MEQEKKKGGASKWIFGCCGGLIVLAILCAGGGWYGVSELKDEVASQVREGISKVMEESELSPEQRTGINAQAERLETAIRNWGLVELVEHMQNLEDMESQFGDLALHAAVVSYGSLVLPRTEMPEEERAAGRRLLQRYARGIDEEKFSFKQTDKNWQLNPEESGDDDVTFKVEEVRRHLADVKQQVDDAGIPDEPYEVDLAEKLKIIADAVIGE